MKKNIFIIVALVAVAFAGCDFLDHEPDMYLRLRTITPAPVRIKAASAGIHGRR